MNYQVDIIIIGDSKEGHEALDKIASGNINIKIAFISRDFRYTTTHDYLNVEYFNDKVVFVDYKNRLFGCYLLGGHRIYSTHLIISTGLKYSSLIIDNKEVPNVFHSANNTLKNAKSLPAIVIGNHNTDAKLALDVAKKYRRVYLCTANSDLDKLTQSNAKKLAEAKNLLVLSNTSVRRFTANDEGLQTVELDSYSTVTCSAIYVRTERFPEVNFIPTSLIQKNETKHLIVADNAESLIIPKCFAIGKCAVKSTKRMQQLMVETVLNDFQ
jgi:thioredoxin reductase